MASDEDEPAERRKVAPKPSRKPEGDTAASRRRHTATTTTSTKCHARASDQVRWLIRSSCARRKKRRTATTITTTRGSSSTRIRMPNLSRIFMTTTTTTTRISSVATVAAAAAILFLLNSAKQTNSYQLANNLIANNLPPKFAAAGTSSGAAQTNSEIVVRVKEGPASIGKLIYTLKGEDPDDDPLTFGVLGSMASDLLRIENVPGNQANVYLRKELDRETTESYQMVITLTDGKLGRGNWVEDINDNYPVFGPHRAAISLREDTKVPLVIETVEASDQDEGRFGQVIYKLEELDDGHQHQAQAGYQTTTRTTGAMFSIETIDGKGVISLVAPLDYEQKALYQLRVTAIDRAMEQERLSTSTNILISVEDCPDNPPMFTFVPSITRVPENLPVGSPVLRVAAIDGDRGINNPIEYRLVGTCGAAADDDRQHSQAAACPFAIERDTGQISVARELDRESSLSSSSSQWTAPASTSGANNRLSSQPGSYVVQVRASELLGSGRAGDDAPSVTTELTIILTDVNDEPPTLDRAHYFGEILENSAPESLVSFTAGPPASDVVNLSSGPWSAAAGAGGGQQPSVAKVIDRDQGTNGTFTLHLEGGEQARLFDIWPREATNEATFMIKVSPAATPTQLAALDFERNKLFQFTVVAREKLQPDAASTAALARSSSARMSVYVKDFNDNYPRFEQDLYRVEIPENAIRGMHICAVRATDLDSGIYGTAGIRYTELRGEKANKFKLDPVSGVITLKTNDHGFDRELMSQHHLIVEARDANGLGNRNTSQLLIVLTDVNDQRPKFLLDQYEAFIYENELDFQSPLQVQAIDNDAPNTGNSRVTYSIVGGDPQQNFTIDPLTGRIRVRSSLIMSSPTGRSLNGNDPQQQQQPGSSTGMHDEMATELATAQVAGLDFERIAQKQDDARHFNLTIKATDAGLPEPLSGLTNVLVLVYDKNDHAPVFTRSVYTKSIREDAREASQVCQVLAQDGDHSPANSRITYRISSGASDKFVIDSETGLISVASGANLDIDRAVGGQKRTNYLLNVVAFDGSFGPNQKSASALVNITILDVNNKAPEFVTLGQTTTRGYHHAGSTISPAVTTTISPTTITGLQQQQQQQQQLLVVYVNEDAPYGLIVTRVVATDLDSGAELRYSINYARSEARNEDMVLVDPSVVKDLFSIEPTDGTIKVSKQLDRELFDQVKLRLQVEDIAAQTPDQLAYTYLLIKITDVNDNRPTFKKPVYKAVVNENSISGTSVITLTADDRDLNKTLKYSLDGSADMMRLVRINPRSGEITVNDKIDRELYSMINVTVRAEDYGHPHPLAGTTQLLITVRDENDNNPVFQNSTRQLPQPPSSSIFGHHQHQTAYDSPSYRNHNMNDSASSSPATTAGQRHRSLGHHHTTHRSSDQQQDRWSDAAAARHQAESGGLVFLGPGSTATVREDAPIGHELAFVRADDADLGNNGRVTYLLEAGSSGGKFRIDRDTGVISVAGSLDRESTRRYSLIIEACDNYDLGYATGESRRAFTQVSIIVTDINDNAPLISTNLQQRGLASSKEASAGARDDELPAAAAADSAGSNPSFEDVMNSVGPFEMPLADCLFISEFQPLNEPILTVTAVDLDDPSTPNGLVDLAIVSGGSGLPQNELFALVPIQVQRPASTSSRPQPATLPPPPAATTIITSSSQPETRFADSTDSTSSLSSSSAADELSFGASLTGAEESGLAPASTTATTVVNTSDEASLISGELAMGPMARPADSEDLVVYTRRAETSRRRRKRSELGNFYSPAATSRALSHHQQQLNTPRVRVRHPQRAPPASGAEASPREAPTAAPPERQQAESGEQQAHLVVTQSLKDRVGNYSILVRATDRGQPQPLSSARLINICVQDVNNHAPVFVRPALNHTIRVLENATIGTYVTRVEATDSDHGQNGELQYSLRPTSSNSYLQVAASTSGNGNGNNLNDWQAFKIDRLSGVISTNKQFNRQVKRYYTLRVQAQDFGKPTALSDDIDINIMIVNSGQYQPEFGAQQQSQQLQFTENVAPGVEWFTLVPTNNLDDDPALIHQPSPADSSSSGDSGSNSSNVKTDGPESNSSSKWLTSPCYFIVDSDDQEQVFHLDRYTHRLTNRKPLDRERKANYTLLVQASNQCGKAPPAPIYRAPTAAAESDSGSGGPSSTQSPASAELAEPRAPSTSGDHFEYRSGSLSLPARSKRSPIVGGKVSNASLKAEPEKLIASIEGGELGGSFSQMAVDSLLASDRSLLKVLIKVKDVNDNAPKFTQKVYTGGITTEADFGTTFMIVQALDADADLNSHVTYSIVKPIRSRANPQQLQALAAASPMSTVAGRSRSRRSPTSATSVSSSSALARQEDLIHHNNQQQQQQPAIVGDSTTATAPSFAPASNFINNGEAPLAEGDDLFVINGQTGEISLNFDPQRHMKGYFEFEIMANDTEGLFDTARVLIYLLRQDQRVKFVLRLTPQELRQRLNKFRSVFGNITGAIVNIDSYKYFENHDGTVDKKKTSLYLHFVQPDDNTIIDVDKVLTLIDNNIEYLDELYKEFHVISSEAAHLPLSSSALVDPITDQIRTGLLGVSSFLALILALVIVLYINQRARYERQLKAATVSAFGGSPLNLDHSDHAGSHHHFGAGNYQTDLPNTNLHSQDPNPIWMNGFVDSHVDWLSGGGGAGKPTKAAGNESKGRANLILTTTADSGAADIEADDCLNSSTSSAAANDDDDDLSSLNGGGGGASAGPISSHLHYNVAATATPRDSLNSSHGRVSGSGSGSSSSTTTNDRQFLCASNRSQTPQKVALASSSAPRQPELVGVLKNGPNSNNKRSQHHAPGGADASHSSSTFGAFKEVTIYTEQPSSHQFSSAAAANNNNNKAREKQSSRSQQQQASQVNKIASQFNAKNQANEHRVPQSFGNHHNNHHHPQQQQQQRRPTTSRQQRVLVHTNGLTETNQNIAKTMTAVKQSANTTLTKINQGQDPNVTSYQIGRQQDDIDSAEQFESKLSKLSILNLETTEL